MTRELATLENKGVGYRSGAFAPGAAHLTNGGAPPMQSAAVAIVPGSYRCMWAPGQPSTLAPRAVTASEVGRSNATTSIASSPRRTALSSTVTPRARSSCAGYREHRRSPESA